MGSREQGVVPGGPSQREAREINEPKPVQGVALNRSKETRTHLVKKAANVIAVGLTAVAGVGLAATVEGALKSTPPPRVQEQKPDPKRDNPPPGVVFSQDTGRKDGGVVEPVLKKRVFIPRVLKDVSQATLDAAERPPLYLREFGAPERGVIMRNKIEQGGGRLAFVEMGDQELWENMMHLRETYGAKDEDGKPLNLEVTFYSSRLLLERDRTRPARRPVVVVIPWDVWARNPGIYQNGIQEFYYQEADKTLDFRITLPETLPGKVPTEDSVNKIHFDFVHSMRSVFLSQKNGLLTPGLGLRGSEEYFDMLNHPVVIKTEPPNIFNISRSALWVKLD